MKPFKNNFFLILLILEISLVAVAIPWGYFRRIHWWQDMIHFLPALWGILFGLCLFIFDTCLLKILRRFPNLHLNWLLYEVLKPVINGFSVAEIIVLSLASGICEEIFFRGVLQHETGIIISNIVFALLHMGNRKAIFMGIWAGLIGILLGTLYKLTGNLSLPVIIHITNNLAAMLYLKLHP